MDVPAVVGRVSREGESDKSGRTIMNKELLGSVVLAAAIGALVSSLVTIIAQWRERAARQREFIFTAAVDISKSWIGRIANASRKNAALSEVMAVERVFEMLVEIFEHGKLSNESRAHLVSIVDQVEALYEKKPS